MVRYRLWRLYFEGGNMDESEKGLTVKVKDCKFKRTGLRRTVWIIIIIALLIMIGRVATSFDTDIMGIWHYEYRKIFEYLMICYGLAFSLIYLLMMGYHSCPK